MNLKQLRQSLGLTQAQAAFFCGMPLRTYKNYENMDTKRTSIPYLFLLEKLSTYGYVDEEHGILSINDIQEKIRPIFDKYQVDFVFLFGSYARHQARENSDIDLFISTSETGLSFYGMIEDLRITLKKKIDLLSIDQLNNNLDLIKEIMKDGIKIYPYERKRSALSS